MAYKIEYKGLAKRDSWECFSWLVTINGQTFDYFTGLGHCLLPYLKESNNKAFIAGNGYGLNVKGLKGIKQTIDSKNHDQVNTFLKTFNLKLVMHNANALDHVIVKVPKLRDVLHSIATDASCAQDSFDDFCSNLGYDTDSRKALETYLACQDNSVKLRKALKSHDAVNRINQWEL